MTTTASAGNRFQHFSRAWSIGAGCGFIAGLITGVAARLAMRVSGFLTDDADRGTLTDAGEAVGDITTGGSVAIVLFVAVLGVALGVYFIVIRRWLPENATRRVALLGLFGLLWFGGLVFEAGNIDFVLFGPTALNLVMYASLFWIYGAALVPLVTFFDRVLPQPPVRPALMAAGAVPVLLSLLPMLLLVFVVLSADSWGGLAALLLVPAMTLWAERSRLTWSEATFGRVQRTGLFVICLVGVANLAGNLAHILA